MVTERKHREDIVRYGRMLHERGFVAAMDGNLSVRLKTDRILVTPTAVSKGAMRPSDMVIVDPEGERISGHRNVTSEIGMHLLIYRLRPDVQAIVHAHPPTATGFAAAGLPLTEPLVCEVVMRPNKVSSSPAATSTTPRTIRILPRSAITSLTVTFFAVARIQLLQRTERSAECKKDTQSCKKLHTLLPGPACTTEFLYFLN